MSEKTNARVGIDIGGTFVDVVADVDATRHIAKLPSDPRAPLVAFTRAIDFVCNEWGIAPGAITSIRHGSTVAVNTVLERTGAKVGLLTTAGFRDVLELGRQRRSDLYALAVSPSTPVFLVPRARRLEVPERISADGSIVEPMDTDAAVQTIHELVADGVEALAICLLFAHINPVHEQQVAALARTLYPDLPVSVSHEVEPLFREYERTAATCFDAYLKPRIGAYLDAAVELLRERGVSAPLEVMDSIGGVRSASSLKSTPIKLLLSGPAAAVCGAANCAGEDTPLLLSVDIGGTSADIGVVAHGRAMTREAGFIDSFTVRTPAVDVTAIGAGGGSIAWIDESGGLQVGPRSAGADPGPACYGRGNSQPTLTDASLVLGYLTADTFARQGIAVEMTRARAAVREFIAEPLGISVLDAALGMFRIANAKMAETVRSVALEHGADPREVALMPLGGAGGLHVVALAKALGAKRVLVPRAPGVMAAEGLLNAPFVFAATSTLMQPLSELTLADIEARLGELEKVLDTDAHREGMAALIFETVDEAVVAFAGQSHTLTVPMPATNEPQAIALAARSAHERVHGHAPAAPVVVHALRRTRVGMQHGSATVAYLALDATAHAQVSVVCERPVMFTPGAPLLVTPCVERHGLGRGMHGPAIVEQLDATLLVPPGWQVQRRDADLLELTPVSAR